jgi:transcription initiation factor TFIIIB Brf1 subunit/transcription initiation factor TFIIB
MQREIVLVGGGMMREKPARRKYVDVYPESCRYCGSRDIVVDGGEYICRSCGSVLGFAVYVESAQPPARRVVVKLPVKRYTLYRNAVLVYLQRLESALRAGALERAVELFNRLDRRVYQGRRPKTVAAALYYLAGDPRIVKRSDVAAVLSINERTVRDMTERLRKALGIVW